MGNVSYLRGGTAELLSQSEMDFVLFEFGFFIQKSTLDSESIYLVAVLVYPIAFIAGLLSVCLKYKEMNLHSHCSVENFRSREADTGMWTLPVS